MLCNRHNCDSYRDNLPTIKIISLFIAILFQSALLNIFCGTIKKIFKKNVCTTAFHIQFNLRLFV